MAAAPVTLMSGAVAVTNACGSSDDSTGLSSGATLVPPELAGYGVEIHHDVEEGVRGADVVMVLRVQTERLKGALLASLGEYSRTFGINRRRLALAKPDALVMHPGPMNRGVEIEPDVADGKTSAVLDQVEAGVAIRMTLLYLLAGEPGEA